MALVSMPLYDDGFILENLELIADIQYQNETYNELFSSTKIADFKQTVLEQNI
jgi:hypothetical protein